MNDRETMSMGTEVDFSNWEVNTNGFEPKKKKPKISMTEKVIEPDPEIVKAFADKMGFDNELTPEEIKEISDKMEQLRKKKAAEKAEALKKEAEAKAVEAAKVAEEEAQKNKRKVPQADIINPVELKNLAVRLMPTADKVKKEDFEKISDNAINLAYTFLSVWNKVVETVKV